MPHATRSNEISPLTGEAVASDADSQTPTSQAAVEVIGGQGDAYAVEDSVQPQDVPAQLHYLSPSVQFSKTDPPIQVVTRSSTTRDPRTTVKISQGPVETIHDVRGREDQFTLERNGFAFVKNECQFEDWQSRDAIWSQYIEELKTLVSTTFGGRAGGVDEIIAFHEGKRGSNKEWRQSSDGQRTNPFARQVHVDQSEPTIRKIVQEKTDIKGEWLWKGRVRQVNAWRPLYHPVYDCGLCVADAATVQEDDLVEAHRIREVDGGFIDTMGVVQYREGRDWYYKSRMAPDDVVLFMGYDSNCKRGKDDGVGFTLHSAFDIPNPPPGSPPRASIEVRLLVFTWPDEPLIIRPGIGMLTTQVPPRSEELYQSHHTENLEVEGYAHHVIRLPDEDGTDIEVDLDDYDPLEPDMLTRHDSALSPPRSPPRGSSRRRKSSIALGEEISEAQLVSLADGRVTDLQEQIALLQRQLQAAEKLRSMMQKPGCKTLMVNSLNERRTDELGRQRLEMARRLRETFGDIDL